MLASLTHLRRRFDGFEAGLANRRLRGFQPSRAHLNTLIAAAGPDTTPTCARGLQMLPSEMLPLNRNEVPPGGDVIRQSIEFDAIGRRVAYQFLRRHPGDMTDQGFGAISSGSQPSEVVHVIEALGATT